MNAGSDRLDGGVLIVCVPEPVMCVPVLENMVCPLPSAGEVNGTPDGTARGRELEG